MKGEISVTIVQECSLRHTFIFIEIRSVVSKFSLLNHFWHSNGLFLTPVSPHETHKSKPGFTGRLNIHFDYASTSYNVLSSYPGHTKNFF